jgi:hypothetical protein
VQGIHIVCKECVERVKYNSKKIRRDNVESLIVIVKRKKKTTQGVQGRVIFRLTNHRKNR